MCIPAWLQTHEIHLSLPPECWDCLTLCAAVPGFFGIWNLNLLCLWLGNPGLVSLIRKMTFKHLVLLLAYHLPTRGGRGRKVRSWRLSSSGTEWVSAWATRGPVITAKQSKTNKNEDEEDGSTGKGSCYHGVLSLIHGTHTVDGEKGFLQTALWPSQACFGTCTLTLVPVHKCTHRINEYV